MASSSTSSFEDVAALSRVVENVFRRLIRILVGRMTLKKLQEMIQVIFVQETEAKLKKEAPGKSVALGDLSLLTGVDTRTIKKARSFIALSDPMHMNEEFLDGFMPFFKLFDLWLNHPDYRDGKTGKPKVLKIAGEGKTFTQLVKAAMPARGLTLYAILKRLKDIGVIEEDAEKGTVRLLQEDNIFISQDELDLIDVGFTAIANLVGTVEHNILQKNGQKFFQRGCWNYQFDPTEMEHVRTVIYEFLSNTDNEARALITSLANPDRKPGQLTAGISMFYFEE
jgi:hypothetical protein